jgi:hypothetical protein
MAKELTRRRALKIMAWRMSVSIAAFALMYLYVARSQAMVTDAHHCDELLRHRRILGNLPAVLSPQNALWMGDTLRIAPDEQRPRTLVFRPHTLSNLLMNANARYTVSDLYTGHQAVYECRL